MVLCGAGRVCDLLAASAHHEHRDSVCQPDQHHRGQRGRHLEPRQLCRQPGPVRLQQRKVRRRIPSYPASATASHVVIERHRELQRHCLIIFTIELISELLDCVHLMKFFIA